jgi:DNA-binding GntR family transcriptional regulator
MNMVAREGRVFESISEDIRSRVASGALKPGDKLSSERDRPEH